MQEFKQQSRQREDLVIGRAAVQELLRSEKPVECIYLQQGLAGTVSKIASLAKEQGIPCKQVDAHKLDSLCDRANHQGIIAQTAAARYSQMEDIFDRAREAGEPVFLVIADEIEDPHNLGAIIRTAEAAGAHGLILPKRRSAGLTFTVTKTSAGASEHLPIVRVPNLASAIDTLKEQGVWIYAADFGGSDWCSVDYSGPVGLVIGSEGKGIGRLIRERSDFIVSLPMRGRIGSLNASVAAGIILYEIARQRAGLTGV